MVTGRMVRAYGDRESITLVGEDITAVNKFPYLGSLIAISERIDVLVQENRRERERETKF